MKKKHQQLKVFKLGVQVQIWLHDLLMLMEMKKLYIIRNFNKFRYILDDDQDNTGSSFFFLPIIKLEMKFLYLCLYCCSFQTQKTLSLSLCVCVFFSFFCLQYLDNCLFFLWSLLTIYIIKRSFHILPISVKFLFSFCHRTQDYFFLFFFKYLFRFNRFSFFFCHLFLLLC